ncbi:hypothetical protein FACS1894169_13440 [Bacteroidia bacterium]|nr:hypothetical protein FACS1894169_13440 [Bacteroidia bacterium]
MEILFPIAFIAIIGWLYMRGRKRLNREAPYCLKCEVKMQLVKSNAAHRRQSDPSNPYTQYGSTLWKYRCPICDEEKIF